MGLRGKKKKLAQSQPCKQSPTPGWLPPSPCPPPFFPHPSRRNSGTRLLRKRGRQKAWDGLPDGRVGTSRLRKACERAQGVEARPEERAHPARPGPQAQVRAREQVRAARALIGRRPWGDIRRWGGSPARERRGRGAWGADWAPVRGPWPVFLLLQVRCGGPVSHQPGRCQVGD